MKSIYFYSIAIRKNLTLLTGPYEGGNTVEYEVILYITPYHVMWHIWSYYMDHSIGWIPRIFFHLNFRLQNSQFRKKGWILIVFSEFEIPKNSPLTWLSCFSAIIFLVITNLRFTKILGFILATFFLDFSSKTET